VKLVPDVLEHNVEFDPDADDILGFRRRMGGLIK
jgi:hypothetical protein